MHKVRVYDKLIVHVISHGKGKRTMDDRRTFERVDTRLPLRFLNPGNGQEGEAETLDISANGIGFVTNSEVAAAVPLEMWLNIPDQHDPFYTRGEVVWSDLSSVTGQRRVGVRLEKAEFMGLGRALWLKKRQS